MSLATSRLVGIDLSAGAGGMSPGADQLGLDVGLAIEVDRHAAETYQENHKATELMGCDARQLTPKHLRRWLDLSRRLDPRSPSIVIGNFRKNVLIHPHEDRGVSVREAGCIQSFPKSYRFHGSIGFQQQQVASAVPLVLARSVSASILRGAAS